MMEKREASPFLLEFFKFRLDAERGMTRSPISPKAGVPRNALIIGAIATVAMVAYLLVSIFHLVPGYWSFTKEVRQFEGRFFRMVVKLDYQGEPQVFDFVVGCQVKSTLYQDGSRSRDVGFIPAVYGRKMKDNKAVVIRPPDVCDGEVSATGQVPAAFMPLIVVYDNADTLDMGLAYMSEDAYASPASDLKFHSAEIIASNRTEFDSDGEKGEPNSISRERYWSAQGDEIAKSLGLKAVWPHYSKRCRYAIRYRIPESIRSRFRMQWPETKPEFWFAKDFPAQQALFESIYAYGRDKNPDYWAIPESGGKPVYPDVLRISDIDHGMARRNVKFRINYDTTMPDSRGMGDGPIVSYYPIFSDLAERYWSADQSKWVTFLDSLKVPRIVRVEKEDGKKRGFAACWDVSRFPQEGPIRTASYRASDRAIASVDGKTVMVQGKSMFTAYDSSHNMFFERDEYFWMINSFDFGVHGGDVR